MKLYPDPSSDLSTTLSARPSLVEDLTGLLRDWIVDGRLPAGERVNEVHLSRDLGVSRTPLREALVSLAAEGALSRERRRGFFVEPLTLEEFNHLYPLRALLDPEALRLGGVPSEALIQELHALNQALAEEGDPRARGRLDDRWHLRLLSGCPNPILLGMISDLMARTRRYELAYLRGCAPEAGPVPEHVAILDALRGGDLSAACAALAVNMGSGTEPIRAWLRERAPLESETSA